MNNILKKLLEKMRKENVPCFIFLVKEDEKPKFIEIIVKRPDRYTVPGIMKRIPKSYHGIKIKAL
jgi:hypothetical protein